MKNTAHKITCLYCSATNYGTELECAKCGAPIKPTYPEDLGFQLVPLSTLLTSSSSRTVGIDVSSWQGTMNWGQAITASAKFAFVRSGGIGSDGILFTDSQFDNNKANTSLLPMGAYFFFRPNFTNPTAYADYFSNLLLGTSFNLPPIIDIELNGGATAKTVADRLTTFYNRVVTNTGQIPAIYTRTSFWNPYVEDRTLWETLDLWIARYSSTLQHPWGDGLYKPRDWSDWRFWQWSETGVGSIYGAQSTNIDLDYFNGDLAALYQYANWNQEPPPPLPVPLGSCHAVGSPFVNIRLTPSISSTDLGDLAPTATKSILYWFEETTDTSGNKWLKIGQNAWVCEILSGVILVARD